MQHIFQLRNTIFLITNLFIYIRYFLSTQNIKAIFLTQEFIHAFDRHKIRHSDKTVICMKSYKVIEYELKRQRTLLFF